ncbi:MAG TPA: PAS domain-containing protein, partial [Candidatus Hydrogenedentes bacterium]|nr:PAS domain-containing protein [Candidatus Hydrogenedentota bacterium]
MAKTEKSPSELVADVLETCRNEVLELVLAQVRVLAAAEARPLVEDWFIDQVETLRGRPTYANELMAALAQGVRGRGRRLCDLLNDLHRIRNALIDFLSGRVPGITDAELYAICLASEDRYLQSVCELYEESSDSVLAAERRRHRAMAEALDRPFVTLDGDGAIVLANSAFAELVSASAASLPGRGLAEFCDAETAGLLRRYVRQRRASAARSFRGSVVSAKGRAAAARFSVSPVFDETGMRDGAAVSVTRQQEDFKPLETLEAWASGPFAIGAAVVDATGAVKHVNDAFCAIAGRSGAAPEKLRFPDVLSDLVPRAEDLLEAACRQETVRVVPYNEGWCVIVGAAVARQESPVHFLFLLIPVAAAETPFVLGEKAVEATAEALGVGLCVVDGSGRVVYANPRGVAWPDLPEDERVAYWRERHWETDLNGTDCRAERVFETGASYSMTVRQENKSGAPRWFECRSLPVFNAKGAVTYVVQTLRDVTQQKTLENQILRQQGTSSMSQLALGVAHQLRNPLGVMLGFAEMLSLGLPPNETAAAAEKVLRHGLRCKEIVDDLLDFGRELPSERVLTDVNRIIREYVQPFYPASVLRRITWRLGEALPQVECAAQQIAQVFSSLIDNALSAASDR